jgi:arginine/lysine/ornithine decarboxylase
MEMETSLQQMMARFLAEMKASYAEMKARQEKAEAGAKARHEEAGARQEKANAELKAAMRSIPSDIDRSLQQQIEAWKERYLSGE